MVIKLLLALVAACGVSGPSDHDIESPDTDKQEDQHFCCQSVDYKTRSGEGCVLAAKEHVAVCSGAIMFCPGFYTLEDGGTVHCPK